MTKYEIGTFDFHNRERAIMTVETDLTMREVIDFYVKGLELNEYYVQKLKYRANENIK